MKRYTTLLVLLAVLAGLSACNEPNAYELNVPPTIDVTSGADIAFKAIGGKGSIEVAPVEGSLQAQTTQNDWCHLTVSGNRIDVEVDEYDGLESRYAVVEMSAGNATGKTIVHQFGVIVKSFAWKDITVKNNRQTIVFPYDANGTTVQVSSDQDWITFETTPEALTLHIAENPTTDYRETQVHWSLGTMDGAITVGQFDPAAAGLLGSWTWHGKQSPNNRDLPMAATLRETGNEVYTLTLTYSTSAIDLVMDIEGITLQTNKLMLPLGNYVGTYTMKRTGVVYYAYPLIASGLSRLEYADAITTGAVPFTLQKDESGVWQAVSDMSAYPDMQFRFEMWAEPEYDEEHEGTSSSGLILSDMYLVKD